MLRYVDETRYLVGIPARDLRNREVEDLPVPAATLINSGLYMKGKPKDQPVPLPEPANQEEIGEE